MSDQVSTVMLDVYHWAKQCAKSAIANGIDGEDFKEAVQTGLVDAALETTNGNKCKAARLLKMHRNTLSRQIRSGY
jgi:DNA-binding NtrC family response regulator